MGNLTSKHTHVATRVRVSCVVYGGAHTKHRGITISAGIPRFKKTWQMMVPPGQNQSSSKKSRRTVNLWNADPLGDMMHELADGDTYSKRRDHGPRVMVSLGTMSDVRHVTVAARLGTELSLLVLRSHHIVLPSHALPSSVVLYCLRILHC